MSDTTAPKLSFVNWYALRDFVLDAMNDKKYSIELLAKENQPELIQLVQQYLATGKDEPIDKAARLVAALAPGVSKEVAENQAWLVLEKS
jgi:hypothetical protein